MTIKLNQLFAVLGLAALLSACGSISLSNPFGGSNPQSRAGVPENATAYECEGGKRFYVRMLNNGNDAWLIYPDHEVNLAKAADNGRFTSGVIALQINGAATTLNDGEKIAYTGCKALVKN
jgi:hypothetical protein